jgi:hypothetical protein
MDEANFGRMSEMFKRITGMNWAEAPQGERDLWLEVWTVRPSDVLRDLRQKIILTWAVNTFGVNTAMNKLERERRFMEEAIELAQSSGMPKEDLIKLVDYVYDRPAGELMKEVGGTMVALQALAEYHDISVDEAERKEVARVLAKSPVEWKSRQNAKHEKGVAMPETTDQQPVEKTQTYEVILMGFDASDDTTDNLVLWVVADRRSDIDSSGIRALPQGSIVSVNAIGVSPDDPCVDFNLPSDNEAFVEKVQELLGQERY